MKNGLRGGFVYVFGGSSERLWLCSFFLVSFVYFLNWLSSCFIMFFLFSLKVFCVISCLFSVYVEGLYRTFWFTWPAQASSTGQHSRDRIGSQRGAPCCGPAHRRILWSEAGLGYGRPRDFRHNRLCRCTASFPSAYRLATRYSVSGRWTAARAGAVVVSSVGPVSRLSVDLMGETPDVPIRKR